MIEVPMTAEQFGKAQGKLRAQGIDLQGTSGTLSRSGVTASYEHTDGVLRISVIDKPFLLPASLVEGQIKAAVEKELAGI